MPRRAQDLTPLGIQKELKAFAASGKKTKALTDGKTPCLRLEMTIGASGVNARWTYKNLKTVESTLSQIRRRRARGTSGLWPSSP